MMMAVNANSVYRYIILQLKSLCPTPFLKLQSIQEGDFLFKVTDKNDILTLSNIIQYIHFVATSLLVLF